MKNEGLRGNSMATKKAKAQLRQESLLSAVARKLGQAAGTVTNLLVHKSAENSSALPAAGVTTIRATAARGAGKQRTKQKTTAHPAATKSMPHPKKRIRRASGTTGKSKRAAAKRTRSHS
jgi:hypothetical protein